MTHQLPVYRIGLAALLMLLTSGFAVAEPLPAPTVQVQLPQADQTPVTPAPADTIRLAWDRVGIMA
jgi:biopolymer transport protein ExbD